MAAYIDARQASDLIAKEMGINLQTLAHEQRQEEERERMAKKTERDRIEAEQVAKKLKMAYQRFYSDLKAGRSLCLVDGKAVSGKTLCKDGNMQLDKLIRVYRATRGRLLMGNSLDCIPGARAGATIEKTIPCSCDKGNHLIKIFISSEKDKTN